MGQNVDHPRVERRLHLKQCITEKSTVTKKNIKLLFFITKHIQSKTKL